MENLQKIVPQLKELSNIKEETTKVELNKGKRVYRILLKDIIATIEKNDAIVLVGVNEQRLLEEIEPIYLEQYFTIIKERNIKEKVIMKKGNKKNLIHNVDYKFLEEKYLGNVEQVIYGKKVAIFIIDETYNLIIIENKQVAETYRKNFELLWKIAKTNI